jgi:hypothetical protein
MAMATQCRFFGHIITIEKALAIRSAATSDQKQGLGFECLMCGEPVRPRSAGDTSPAHFVHLSRNPRCQFTDPPREY